MSSSSWEEGTAGTQFSGSDTVFFNARKSLEEKNLPAVTTLKKSPIDLHLNAVVASKAQALGHSTKTLQESPVLTNHLSASIPAAPGARRTWGDAGNANTRSTACPSHALGEQQQAKPTQLQVESREDGTGLDSRSCSCSPPGCLSPCPVSAPAHIKHHCSQPRNGQGSLHSLGNPACSSSHPHRHRWSTQHQGPAKES